MIFVAIPYGHPHPSIVQDRVDTVCEYCANLLANGLRPDWEAWKSLCGYLLYTATELHVITVAGWEESKGVQEEINIANHRKIPIKYINPI